MRRTISYRHELHSALGSKFTISRSLLSPSMKAHNEIIHFCNYNSLYLGNEMQILIGAKEFIYSDSLSMIIGLCILY